MKKNLVFLTGAGISAESGISTFRDSDGLWNNFRIEDVATLEAWEKNPELVQDFYNQRRKNVIDAQPNLAHEIITHLESYFNVHVITQNVDDLHERALTKNITHLHGNIRFAKSSNPKYKYIMTPEDKEIFYPIDGDTIKYPDDKAPDGYPLRPHVVWFGESVPEMINAERIVFKADFFVIVGTSMQVYPAANLIHELKPWVPIYYVDPNPCDVHIPNEINYIKHVATTGMQIVKRKLLEEIGQISA